MSIDIKETFKVAAPIDKVWDFFLSPDNVVACMPGASLTEIVNAQRFIGAVKIKIGAVSAQYQGTITYQTLDKDAYTMQMLAEGSERGGGTVSGTIATQLVALPDGSGTDVLRMTPVGVAAISDGPSHEAIMTFFHTGSCLTYLQQSAFPVGMTCYLLNLLALDGVDPET